MPRKRFGGARTGLEYLRAMDREQLLVKLGFGMRFRGFWKAMGKGLLCTYAFLGAIWILDETSPFGWWTLKPRPKEERELAHLYERRQYPYPGDEAAMEEFIAKGGMIGTAIGPKGTYESDNESFASQIENKKFEQEAQKLWFRMRNEVISELQEKGFDVE